jgi:hypothetical protein
MEKMPALVKAFRNRRAEGKKKGKASEKKPFKSEHILSELGSEK